MTVEIAIQNAILKNVDDRTLQISLHFGILPHFIIGVAVKKDFFVNPAISRLWIKWQQTIHIELCAVLGEMCCKTGCLSTRRILWIFAGRQTTGVIIPWTTGNTVYTS